MLVIVLKVSKEKQRTQKIEKRLDSYLSGFTSKKRMPIEEKEIERVKSNVSLAAVIRSRGIILKKKGKQLWGLCPFHVEDEPSFAVDEKKGLWNCLGKCQTGGDVFNFVMKSDGINFKQAFELLAENAPSKAANPKGKASRNNRNGSQRRERDHEIGT